MNRYDENRITYLAITDSRNKRIPFGIKAGDRTKHMYVIGKSGMGKSTLLENMAVQDIRNGEGFAFIDPHGGTAEKLLNYVPEDRIKDVLYLAPFDLDYPVSFNVLEDVGADKRHLVVNGLMSAFKKIWVDAWSARMEYILNNIILALLEYPEATLLGVNRMLADKDYRNKVVANVTDPAVKSFWVDEFSKYGERYMQEAGASIQNKTGQFVSSPLIRNMVGQPRSSFNLREMMDNQKIIIINLSKGKVGEANANLLGSMLITKVYLAAMSRADVSAEVIKQLPNFYLYVDEFQSFANESFANILSEARKYKLNLTIAHQYIEQMSDEVRAAVFGNVGTMITFRVGAYDAEIFQKEYAPQFTAEDMVNLGAYQIYLKLMIDGVTSKPFSAIALPPITPPQFSYVDKIIHTSRMTYAQPRYEVEEYIMKWHLSEREDVSRKEGGSNVKLAGDRGERKDKKTFAKDKPKDDRAKQKIQPFKDAFKSVRISNEEKEERENELRRAITNAYVGHNAEGEVVGPESSNGGDVAKNDKTGEGKGEVAPEKAGDLSKKQEPIELEPDIEKDIERLRKPPKDPRSINSKKEATPENLASLKSVLSSVMPSKKSDNGVNEKKEEKEEEKEKVESSESSNKNEIPESVLRSMLEVDEEDKKKK